MRRNLQAIYEDRNGNIVLEDCLAYVHDTSEFVDSFYFVDSTGLHVEIGWGCEVTVIAEGQGIVYQTNLISREKPPLCMYEEDAALEPVR